MPLYRHLELCGHYAKGVNIYQVDKIWQVYMIQNWKKKFSRPEVKKRQPTNCMIFIPKFSSSNDKKFKLCWFRVILKKNKESDLQNGVGVFKVDVESVG